MEDGKSLETAQLPATQPSSEAAPVIDVEEAEVQSGYSREKYKAALELELDQWMKE